MSGDPTQPRHRYAVDDRLVMPESRFEVVDGEVVYVSPADPPHASLHSKLSALLEAHCAEGYDAASDMLTRTSERNDMAPDGSIYPLAPDPATGGRQLELLAFEVVSTERLSAAGVKAARLAERGVARVFAIDVGRQRALEWSRETEAWQMLALDSTVEHACLVAPLPVAALVGAARADDAIARALLAKRNPVLTEALEAAQAAGKAEAVLAVLDARAVAVEPSLRVRILGERDPAMLTRWVARAAVCERADEVVDED